MIRAIVFDLDNTLTDFMKMKEAAISAAIDGMIDAGFRLPRAELRQRVDAIYREQGLEFQRVFDELLELIRRGIRLGVVSDAPRLQVWMRLCALGLQHVFEAVVTFEDTGERKPAPAPFREVLRRLGVDPHEAMMIGDWAERDVVGAKGLGMTTVFARYGDTFDTKVSGADHDIDDLLELVAIVDALHGAA